MIAELDPRDQRIVALGNTDSDEGASEFGVAVLADASLSETSARHAMLLLLWIPTDRLIAAVLGAMRRGPTLAVAAGRVLRRVKNPNIIPQLGTILDDSSLPSETRAAAAGVIGHLGNPNGKEALVRALKSPSQDPEVLCEIAYGLGYIQLLEGKTETATLLCDLLASDTPDVRLAALNGLSNMWARSAVNRIEQLIDDLGVSKDGEHVGTRAAVVASLLRTSTGT